VTLIEDEEKALLCAANNADFYQSIFRALGLRDRRDSDMWSSEALAPPYYSNLTTLNPYAEAKQVVEASRLSAILGRHFSIKDGFCRLALAEHGFVTLFSAEWVWADCNDLKIRDEPQWQEINDPVALRHWEQSWKKGGSPTDEQIFAPTLLDDESISIFGRKSEGGFDAGCIANRSINVIGITNIFHLEGSAPAYGEAVSVVASTVSEGLPLVG
jgi:hypothetical protein